MTLHLIRIEGNSSTYAKQATTWKDVEHQWPPPQLFFCPWRLVVSAHGDTGRGAVVIRFSGAFPFPTLGDLPAFAISSSASLSLSPRIHSQILPKFLTMAILICLLSVHDISMMKTVVEKLQDFCEAWASACERWLHLAEGRGNRWHGARLATGRRPIQRERRGYYLQSLTSTQRKRRWGRGGRFKRKTCGWRKLVRSGKLSGIYVWRQLRRRRRGGKVDRW